MPSTKTFNNRLASEKLGINSYVPPWNIEDTQCSDVLNLRFRQSLISQVQPKIAFTNLYAVNTPGTSVVEYTPPSDSTTYAGYNNYLLSVNAGPTQAVTSLTFTLAGTITGNILSNSDYQQRWNPLEYPSLATILFSNQDSLTPTITVSEPGLYTFRLFAASPVTGIWAWSIVSVYVAVAPPKYIFLYQPLINNSSLYNISTLSSSPVAVLDGVSFTPSPNTNYFFNTTCLFNLQFIANGTVSASGQGEISLASSCVSLQKQSDGSSPIATSGYAKVTLSGTGANGTQAVVYTDWNSIGSTAAAAVINTGNTGFSLTNDSNTQAVTGTPISCNGADVSLSFGNGGNVGFGGIANTSFNLNGTFVFQATLE